MYNMDKKAKIIQCFECRKEIVCSERPVIYINPETKELCKLHEECLRILYFKKMNAHQK